MKRKKKRVKNYMAIRIVNSITNKEEEFETERLTIVIGKVEYRIDKIDVEGLRIFKYDMVDIGIVIMPVVSNVIQIK